MTTKTLQFKRTLIIVMVLSFVTGVLWDTNANAQAQARVFIRDHLGSVTTITDQKGNVLQRNVITPYGQVLRMTDSDGVEINMQQSLSKRFFTGHYYDEESNLHYMNARYYDVVSKRFASLDPSYYGYKPGKAFAHIEESTMASNPMMYVDGMPTTKFDPDGLFSFGGFFRSLFNMKPKPVKKIKKRTILDGPDAPPGKKRKKVPWWKKPFLRSTYSKLRDEATKAAKDALPNLADKIKDNPLNRPPEPPPPPNGRSPHSPAPPTPTPSPTPERPSAGAGVGSAGGVTGARYTVHHGGKDSGEHTTVTIGAGSGGMVGGGIERKF